MSPDTVAWSSVRAEAIRKFGGQTPRAEDEQVVIDVFEVMPEAIQRHIDEVARALEEKRITWAWSVLAKRLQSASEPLREAVASSAGPSKARRIHLAEQLIVNSLCHCLNEEQVLAELYEDGGEKSGPLLQDFRDDEGLRRRMLALWLEKRPLAEASERAVVEHMARWRRIRVRSQITAMRRILNAGDFARYLASVIGHTNDEAEREALSEFANVDTDIPVPTT